MKLWGGRFAGTTDKFAEDFQSSIGFDQRLYREDIQGSIAHATMLGSQGIISQEEARRICQALQEIEKEIQEGKVVFNVAAEDIHMNIEQLLTEKLGELGKKLHTARSRNDQIAVDMRLWMRGHMAEVREKLLDLEKVLLRKAEEHVDTVMPGYTHLQIAQPITFAHHLLAYVQMFHRDRQRLADCSRRMNQSPLGSGALAGTTFPIDRRQTAAALGFDAPTANSLDGVSDRDFLLEYMAAASILMMHLSRFCEEIILWSSHEYAFVTLDDAFSTGSSIMPQKKNPDMAELIRGKTGRVYGNLMGLLTVMKGLPLAYNKDMQEDKEAVFEAADTVLACLTVFIPMLDTMRINKQNMRNAAGGGFINATDMADYLVKRGLPFRDAHGVTGRLVLYCEAQKKELGQLTLEELRRECDLFDEDLYQAISLQQCVAARESEGGPAPRAVLAAIRRAKEELELSE
ncbi:MAG: argininosuccinate lyase [Firmicutes bacterium]|nr:argininosuccinate lyase [Bacillota bacterium]